MSYDVHLTVDTGGPEPHEIWSINHTSNTAGMWRAAGCDITAFHGREAAELAIAAHEAIQTILADPARFKAMEPPNGWGTIATTLGFLTNIRSACERHPRSKVGVST